MQLELSANSTDRLPIESLDCSVKLPCTRNWTAGTRVYVRSDLVFFYGTRTEEMHLFAWAVPPPHYTSTIG